MATIYDEIKQQFNEALNEGGLKDIIDSKELSDDIFDLAIDILLKQIKALRKNNFEETRNIVSTDATELIRTVDQEIENIL